MALACAPAKANTIARGQVVPAQAPDTVPAWASADSNTASPSALIPSRFRKRIIIVQFRGEATQKDRQAAIDLISGTVVGGYNGGTRNGIYLVRVADPGDGSGLIRAANQLQALKSVLAASPDFEIGINGQASGGARAPDTVPMWVRADSNFVGPSAYIPVRFRKGLVVVHFRPGASQQERQAAINMVSGTVVGGVSGRTGNGFYLVRVSDPGDGSGIIRAAERLKALESVTSAGPDIEFGPD